MEIIRIDDLILEVLRGGGKRDISSDSLFPQATWHSPPLYSFSHVRGLRETERILPWSFPDILDASEIGR